MSNVSGFLNSFQHVICISLPESSARKKHINRFIEKYQVKNFQFFDATEADDDEVQRALDRGLVKHYPKCFRCGNYECGDDNCNNTLIPPQIATFLSYMHLWEFIVAAQYGSVLIIEDDIELSSVAESACGVFLKGDWLEKSNLLQSKPMLLRFGWGLCQDHQASTNFSFTNDIKMSNPCHAINSAMAGQLLSKFSIIDTTVDIYMHRQSTGKADSKTGFPPIFTEKSWSTGEFDSLIHPKQVRLDYLEAKGLKDSPAYVEASNRLTTHRAHTNYRKVLSVGHPCCGSSYTVDILRAAGLEIGYEIMDKDGIASWMYAVFDEKKTRGIRGLANSRRNTWFKCIIQNVRNPINAIPSIMRENTVAPESFEFRKKHILQMYNVDISCFPTNLESAIASLVYWNKMIESQSPDFIYKIEEGQSDLLTYMRDVSFITAPLTEADIKGVPVFKDRLLWDVSEAVVRVPGEDMQAIGPHLLELLNDYCQRYGYNEWAT